MTSNRQCSHTKVKTEEFTFEWIIENFRLLPHKNKRILYSPTFEVGINKLKWGLKLYPKGEREETSDFVSLFLEMRSLNWSTEIAVNYHLSFRKSNVVLAEYEHVSSFESLAAWGLSKFIKRDALLKACKDDDSFTIVCKLQQAGNTVTTSKERIISFNMENHKLGEDFRLLKESNRFSDFTIIVGDRKFPAHKLLLTARSSVFGAMFSYENMKENATNELKINDLEPEVVEGMLEFIYTDQVTNLKGLADGLIVASQKYDLERLRVLCEKTLHENLDTENAVDILVLVHLYGSREFTDHVIDFIADHFDKIMKSGLYTKINDCELLKKVVHSVAIRKE